MGNGGLGESDSLGVSQEAQGHLPPPVPVTLGDPPPTGLVCDQDQEWAMGKAEKRLNLRDHLLGTSNRV